MGFNDFNNQYQHLITNDIIENNKNEFIDNLKRAAIARAITHDVLIPPLDQTAFKKARELYSNLVKSKNIIYREPNEDFDGGQITDKSEDGCGGDKILFTVHFGHITNTTTDAKADAYVIDENPMKSLNLYVPDKAALTTNFTQPIKPPTPKKTMNELLISELTKAFSKQKIDLTNFDINQIDFVNLQIPDTLSITTSKEKTLRIGYFTAIIGAVALSRNKLLSNSTLDGKSKTIIVGKYTKLIGKIAEQRNTIKI
jgi:hypothetical protein